MTKRIIISLAMIALVIAGVTSATVAYFSATASKTGNTFSMGTVTLSDSTNGFPFAFANLIPGSQSESGLLQVQYTGSIPADLYFGVKAESGTDLKDILKMQIERMRYDGANWVHDAWIFPTWEPVVTAFASWTKVSENVTQNQWNTYKISLLVKEDAGNGYQGKSATNTVFIYAVQHGYSAPGTAPYIYTPTP